MESIGKDATLKAGWYDCFADFAEHTFCRVEPDGGMTSWFSCYGGHRSKRGRVFPSMLGKPTYWRTITNHNSVRVNIALARGICCGDPFDVREEYDLKERHPPRPVPWFILGDCSGLVYGSMGVCHNMCNRIMMASRNGNKSLINRPPSFEASYYLYGYWGGGLWPKGEGSSIDGRWGKSAMRVVKYVEELIKAKGEPERQKIRNAMQESFLAELRSYLENAHTPEARHSLLEEMFMPFIDHALAAGEDPSLTIEDVVQLDRETQQTKQDVDQLLLGGRITNEEYADAVNNAVKGFFKSVRDRLGQDRFKDAFGFDPDAENACTVIIVEHMPTQDQYAEVGRAMEAR